MSRIDNINEKIDKNEELLVMSLTGNLRKEDKQLLLLKIKIRKGVEAPMKFTSPNDIFTVEDKYMIKK